MKLEQVKAVERLNGQKQYKTLLSRLKSWILSGEIEISDLLYNCKDGYLLPIPSFLLNKIGSIFYRGNNGSKKDPHAAFLFFKCSAELGNPFACGNFAQFYFDGQAPEGKQLLLAEYYCRQALNCDSERYILLMAEIFFDQNEFKRAMICIRDILSSVRTYDHVYHQAHQAHRSRWKIVLKARNLEKECLNRLLSDTLLDIANVRNESRISNIPTKSHFYLNSPTFQSSPLCKLVLEGQNSSPFGREVGPEVDSPRPVKQKLSSLTVTSYINLPGWTSVNSNIDGFDVGSAYQRRDGNGLSKPQLSTRGRIDIPAVKPPLQASLSCYTNIEEHILRRQLMAEKVFFQVHCKNKIVAQLARSFMKSRLRDDDPRQEEAEATSIRLQSFSEREGCIPSSKSILMAERAVIETSANAYTPGGDDSKIFATAFSGTPCPGSKEDNRFYSGENSDEDTGEKRHSKIESLRTDRLFTGWSRQENILLQGKRGTLKESKASNKVLLSPLNSPVSASPLKLADSGIKIDGKLKPSRPGGKSSPARSKSSDGAQLPQTFLQRIKSAEALAAVLPAVPVLVPQEEMARLNKDDFISKDSKLSLLTFPETVFIGNISISYRHKVYLNLQSLECDYFLTTSLEERGEISNVLNSITQVAKHPENEARLARLMIRFLHRGQPLTVYDLKQYVNPNATDDDATYLNTLTYHIFVKRLSSFILPFSCQRKYSSRTLSENQRQSEDSVRQSKEYEQSVFEVPLASAQARALRLVAVGYLSFSELLSPPSIYSILHFCYPGGASDCCRSCYLRSAGESRFEESLAFRELRKRVVAVNALYDRTLLFCDDYLSGSDAADGIGMEPLTSVVQRDPISVVQYWKIHPQGQLLPTFRALLKELDFVYGGEYSSQESESMFCLMERELIEQERKFLIHSFDDWRALENLPI